MGSEFLNESAPPLSYAAKFHELCPFYISIGMTYGEYWNGAAEMPKAYRQAYKLRCEHENYYAWLQGAYVYDALCAVSPVLQAFAKRGTKPAPYHAEPYGSQKAHTKDEEAQPKADAAKFFAFASQFNKSLKQNERL